ncbi:NAD(P)/FAD-dependent oxidoreductase [Robertkochia marina]|uniref:NAD(P)/FAD-dependent oxidoreductase n=1 Tax=Robertkochia marina TaxID=1227945 RepID=A0A4S3M5E4_9FLAO|nr:FAD-dependent oxidoreductase [Robertkochia marina]THD69437.1 NAD(P)/FAD-dependent oxidoreductase [Robertkochia marina]TRZ47302.1 NAD(P)/FAD-dependent oxidoreductase [Robertkochia marina]
MKYDLLIIGGGAAGMQCALVIGSAVNKPYALDKVTGIIMHQKASHLQNALFNNVLGLKPGTLGIDILEEGKQQLATLYPHIDQIHKEKVLEISEDTGVFQVRTSKSVYTANKVVIAVGYTDLFNIKGLESYIEPHALSPADKNRIQLRNTNHLVTPGIWVAGTLAGWRSQFAIAAGSGAQVATDILTLWNDGIHTKVHDKVAK